MKNPVLHMRSTSTIFQINVYFCEEQNVLQPYSYSHNSRYACWQHIKPAVMLLLMLNNDNVCSCLALSLTAYMHDTVNCYYSNNKL